MEEKRKRGRPVGTGRPQTKMNKAEVNKFIKESIKKIMDEHLSWTEYVNWCRGYNISQAQANNHWKTAWESIHEKYELDRNKQITKHLRKYWTIHDEAVRRGDLNTARQSLNDIAKLMGLNEPDKMETNETITFNFGDEE